MFIHEEREPGLKRGREQSFESLGRIMRRREVNVIYVLQERWNTWILSWNMR